MPELAGRRPPDGRLPDRRPRRRRRPGQPPRRRPPPRPARRRPASRSSSSVGPPQGIAASYVDVDNRQGARSAVEHLIAGGRRVDRDDRRPATWPPAIDRLAGYRDALAEAGLARRPEPRGDRRLHPGERRRRDGAGCSPPDRTSTRVFAASDLMAAGALAVLAAAGRRVPADVAVVGFDDSPVATTTTPPADQRPSTDRGDGPRGGPPARRCRRGLGPRAPARDPGHRAGTARIERREARRPEPAGDRRTRRPTRARPSQPSRPHEVEIDVISQRGGDDQR